VHSFTELIGDLKSVIQQNFNEKVLSGIDLFATLTSTERSIVVDALTEEVFPKGTPVIKQGDAGDVFYIIKSGKLQLVSEGISRLRGQDVLQRCMMGRCPA
jgi:cGMP-dependent protein kinase 1